MRRAVYVLLALALIATAGGVVAFVTRDKPMDEAPILVPDTNGGSCSKIDTPGDSGLPSDAPANRPVLSHPVFWGVRGVGGDEFCAEFPTDGDRKEIAVLEGGAGKHEYTTNLKVDPETGDICPTIYADDPRCNGFNVEIYTVEVSHHPGLTAQQAMDVFQRQIPPGSFGSLRRMPFRGDDSNPAFFGTIQAKEGGSGTYVAVWHNEAIYRIWSSGLQEAPNYAEEFEDSFQFAD